MCFFIAASTIKQGNILIPRKTTKSNTSKAKLLPPKLRLVLRLV
jgi:hypothetical protein